MFEKYIKQLNDILKSTQWTQEKLARELNVTFATLNRWINNHTTPHPSNVSQIQRLHKEYVGFQPIPLPIYQAFLKQSLKYKVPTIRNLLLKNKKILDELTIDGTYNSNTIEGTTLTFKETQVLLQDHVISAHKPYQDHLLATNHGTILRNIFQGMYAGPINEKNIKEMHARLFQGVREDGGRYSKYPRGIVGLNLALTHPEDIQEEMSHLLSKINHRPKKLNPIEFMAICHAEFELIHPFGDGNGRIGRFLLILQSLNEGFPPIIIENKRKSEYFEALEHAQRKSEDHLTKFLVEELQRVHGIIKKYI